MQQQHQQQEREQFHLRKHQLQHHTPHQQSDQRTSCAQDTLVQQPKYVPPHLPNTVPTIKNVEHIDPTLAQEMLRNSSCILVDLRGEDRASGLIEGAVHEPAIDTVPFTSKVPKLVQKWADISCVIFTCQYSAHRAPQCANWYREKADRCQRVAVLSGGFRGWEATGLPVKCAADSRGAKLADEVAVNLGTKFVEGCLAGVPGGGFFLPTNQPPKPPPHAQTQLKVQNQQESGGAAQKAYIPPHLPNTVPTIEDVENIDPKKVHDLLQAKGCLLVDLRGEDRAAGLIDGAVHEPAIDTVPFPMKVPKLVQKWADQNLIVFTCQYSAHRAPQCANWYRQKANPRQRVAILSGGFRGWEALGLPVQSLAAPDAAHAADEAAKLLGSQFAGGCVTRVPGGGFSVPGQ